MEYDGPYEAQREFRITVYDIFGPDIYEFDLKIQ